MTAEPIVACCGLVCADCPAFIATRDQDEELLRRTAERWSEPGREVRPDDIRCDGCLGTEGRMNVFCSACRVRRCAIGNGLANCGWCDDYPCATLEEHWRLIKAEEEARPVLDAVSLERTG
ncbi:DUF3795 domain-containing protein [candidate division WOR-3 bacterium]|nr:DUF3795 domain-containing protein [candidate division WOR-3 bacterium]